MNSKTFSLYELDLFLREAGAERVTEEAVLALDRELSKLAETIAESSIKYANHAGRSKLIRKEDVLLSNEDLFLEYAKEFEAEGKNNK
jgi:histone H3/H4